MLLTKSELALAALASKDPSRFTLQAIAVDKQETVPKGPFPTGRW